MVATVLGSIDEGCMVIVMVMMVVGILVIVMVILVEVMVVFIDCGSDGGDQESHGSDGSYDGTLNSSRVCDGYYVIFQIRVSVLPPLSKYRRSTRRSPVF